MEIKLKRILVIDDDETSNFINEIIIGRAEIAHDVKVFICANEALEYLKNGNDFPDLILLDINMPFIDGWEFLQAYFDCRFNQKHKTLICMLSSSIYESDRTRAASYPDRVEFISKPLTVESLHELATIVKERYAKVLD